MGVESSKNLLSETKIRFCLICFGLDKFLVIFCEVRDKKCVVFSYRKTKKIAVFADMSGKLFIYLVDHNVYLA